MKHPLPRIHLPPRFSSAFTLTECLLVMGLVAVVLVLVMSVVGKVGKRADDIKCLTYLRNIGFKLLEQSMDQNGELGTHYSGAIGPDSPIRNYGYPWTYQLVERTKKLTAQEMLDFRCPLRLADPDSYTAEHYGFFIHDPHGEVLSDGQGRAYRIRVRTHPSPGSAILLADSTLVGSDRQTYRILPLPASRSMIDLRHHSRAQLFFLDGHIEAATATRLYELGVSYAYDPERRLVIALDTP